MEQSACPVKVRSAGLLRKLGPILFSVLGVGMTAWGVLAVYYSNLPGWLRPTLAIVVAAGALYTLGFMRPRWRGHVVFLASFVILVTWWLSIPPSNDRHWQRDVALLPSAQIDGNRLTVYNLRNCDYRSETDFDVHYEDRVYDLDKLRTADLFLIYWGSPMIAHTMMSFGFEDDQYLCISIETRKEMGEDYSAIRGFFKQYELTYVLADERDLVRLRTNYRGEDVYLYRLNVTAQSARGVLLDYLAQVNRLKDRAEWYNALTSNCTTNIRGHARPYAVSHWDWRILLNGYVDEMAYENGRLDQSLPFAELRLRSRINERGKAADKDPAFSRRIREALPGMEKKP